MAKPPRPKPWHADARRLCDIGWTYPQIAEYVGVCAHAVFTYLNPAYREQKLAKDLVRNKARAARLRGTIEFKLKRRAADKKYYARRCAEDPEYRKRRRACDTVKRREQRARRKSLSPSHHDQPAGPGL